MTVSRVRTGYSEAFGAVAAYKELPFAIRRRWRRDLERERRRLSEEGRSIQQQLSSYRVWTRGESAEVGSAYIALVAELRASVGAACRQAWI